MRNLKRTNKILFHVLLMIFRELYEVKEEMSFMKKLIIGILLIVGFTGIPSLETDTLNRFNPGRLQVINYLP